MWRVRNQLPFALADGHKCFIFPWALARYPGFLNVAKASGTFNLLLFRWLKPNGKYSVSVPKSLRLFVLKSFRPQLGTKKAGRKFYRLDLVTKQYYIKLVCLGFGSLRSFLSPRVSLVLLPIGGSGSVALSKP